MDDPLDGTTLLSQPLEFYLWQCIKILHKFLLNDGNRIIILQENFRVLLNVNPFKIILAYIGALCTESKEIAVNQLLSHLPLLQPGNDSAKCEYLNIIPKILAHSIENGIHIEESRQLLSYSLIHPAINSDERSQFTLWLNHLEERCSFGIYQQQTCLTQQNKESLGEALHLIPHSEKNEGQNSDHMEYNSGVLQQAAINSEIAQSVVSWQHTGQRDRNIIIDSPSLGHVHLATHGRPITACSSNPSSSHIVPGAVNRNGASDHTPLHATQSGPPVCSMQSQGAQGKLDSVCNEYF